MNKSFPVIASMVGALALSAPASAQQVNPIQGLFDVSKKVLPPPAPAAPTVGTQGQAAQPAATSTAPASEPLDDEPLDTVAGPLGIGPARNGDDIGKAVFVNGVAVTTDDSAMTARVFKVYPQNAPAKLVLVAFSDGGVACPQTYRLLDLSRKPIFASKDLGNCNEKATFTVKGDVATIHTPAMGSASAETWVYKNGVLSQGK